MLLSGLPFLLGFLPITLLGCRVLNQFGDAWIKTWLIAASLAFYAIGAAVSLPFLVVSVAGNYAFLQLQHRAKHPSAWAIAGVVANLALLLWFKLVPFSGPMPLGLSFFTFSQIACLLYCVDATQPPKLRDYCLYAAFFPALVAGPVMQPADMLPQCARRSGWCPTAETLSIGLGYLLIGLLKKSLLADPLVPLVDRVFDHVHDPSLLQSWWAACAYSLQLYFDFSGYSDMAIGLARMVGLILPDNFDRPYRASSVIEYWQRWHMSLTAFVMNHVHRPLTLALMRWRVRHGRPIDRAGQIRLIGFLTMIATPILVTMMLVALWHGTTMPFLLFGVVHASFLLVNHAWRLFRAPSLPILVSRSVTYLCVLAAAVIFRSKTVADAGAILAGMIGLNNVGTAPIGDHGILAAAWLVILYVIVWFAPTTGQIMSGEGSRLWQPSSSWGAVMGGAATLGLLASGGSGEFVYFRF